MSSILDFFSLSFRHFLWFFISPLFWLVLVIIYYQYRRVERMEKNLFGKAFNSLWEQLSRSIFLGCLGGFLAGTVLLILGLPINLLGVGLIWPVLIALALIDLRFICFAYAGGIVALFSLFTQLLASAFPAIAENNLISRIGILDIYIPGLLILVALLHLVESFLIYFSGHRGASPVFFKMPGGKIVGGFSLQRLWPLPMLTIWLFAGEPVSMPQWWPVLSSWREGVALEPLVFSFVLVVAVLGYGDFSLSSSPREKSISSARFLFLYSVILLAMAFAADYYYFFIIPACIFAPLGHEMVVYLGNKREMSGKALYVNPETGLKVLAVFAHSPAFSAGIREDDIIERVNGEIVQNTNHLRELINQSYFMVHLTVLRKEDVSTLIIKKTSEQRDSKDNFLYNRRAPLGIIFVPDEYATAYLEKRKISPFRNLSSRFKKMFKR